MRFYAPKLQQTDTRVRVPTVPAHVDSTQVWGQRRPFSQLDQDPEGDADQLSGWLALVEPTDVSPGGRDYISKKPLRHTHDASDIVSGIMATSRLGTGTADSTTFLRGDSTWVPTGGFATSTFRTIDCPAGSDPVADAVADTLHFVATGVLTITGDSATDTITFDVPASASASNSFERISCPIGTNPLATSPTDTLTLTAGAGMTVTGDAATDTIDFVCTITQYTDENAQDAVGGMVDTTLNYVDGTPLLQRAALTGDVTASAGSNTTVIANDAVTYAKIQNVTDARLLGRSAGSSGDVQEITVGAGLSLSAGSLTSTITQYTDELAQDAVGAMVTDGTLVYIDATPILKRAAITGDITIADGSNASVLATKHKTRSHIFYTENPIAGMDIPMLYVGDAVTIIAIRSATDTGTASFNIEQRGKFTPRTAGTDCLTADQAADSTGEETTSSFNDATVPADSNLAVAVSATTGSPTWLWVNVEYTID